MGGGPESGVKNGTTQEGNNMGHSEDMLREHNAAIHELEVGVEKAIEYSPDTPEAQLLKRLKAILEESSWGG